MKKIFLSVLLLTMASPLAECGSGDSFAGGLAGGVLGGVVGSAITKDRRGSRAEDEAREARRETEQLRREQARDRMQQIEQKVTAGGINFFWFLLIGLIFILLVIVGVLMFMLSKKGHSGRPRGDHYDRRN